MSQFGRFTNPKLGFWAGDCDFDCGVSAHSSKALNTSWHQRDSVGELFWNGKQQAAHKSTKKNTGAWRVAMITKGWLVDFASRSILACCVVRFQIREDLKVWQPTGWLVAFENYIYPVDTQSWSHIFRLWLTIYKSSKCYNHIYYAVSIYSRSLWTSTLFKYMRLQKLLPLHMSYQLRVYMGDF